MGALLPWGQKNQGALVPAQPQQEEPKPVIHAIAPIKSSSEIVIQKGRGGSIVQVRSKQIMIGKSRQDVDPYQLIRMIKRLTQNIGEYKASGDVFAEIIVPSLRKARGDLVGILEKEFRIHWEIDEESGRSNFYV